jgi:hypothetical protein
MANYRATVEFDDGSVERVLFERPDTLHAFRTGAALVLHAKIRLEKMNQGGIYENFGTRKSK